MRPESGEAATLFEALPGVCWDPRVGVWRAPASARRRLLEIAHERGLVTRGPPSVAPRRLSRSWWNPIPLRGYQREAVGAWAAAGYRGVFVLPTGAGKTRAACAAIAVAGWAALILVPTRVLLHQWVAELARWYRGSIARRGDGHREVGPVTVSTYASMWQSVDVVGHRFGTLVVDEVHHFGMGRWTEILDLCAAGVRLGLTATLPERPEHRAALQLHVGPVVSQLAVSALVGSSLAPFERIVLTCELEPAVAAEHGRDLALFRRAYAAFARASLTAFEWRDFARACRRTEAGREAMAAWRRSRERLSFPPGKARLLAKLLSRHHRDRVLVFTPSNRVTYRIVREHLIAPITCDIMRAEREAILERFRAGTLRALVSSRVLNEGLDVPAAEVAVIVGGGSSTLAYIQRVGRVLRPGVGKLARIYELVVSGSREMPALERRWRALHAS